MISRGQIVRYQYDGNCKCLFKTGRIIKNKVDLYEYVPCKACKSHFPTHDLKKNTLFAVRVLVTDLIQAPHYIIVNFSP